MRTTSSLKVGGSRAGAVAVRGRTASAAMSRRRVRIARLPCRSGEGFEHTTPLTPPRISSTIGAALDASGAERQSDASWRQTIAEMHASGRQAVLAITGGGSGAIAQLLRVPRGPPPLLEALVPYDARALAAFLGFQPDPTRRAGNPGATAQRAREPAGEPPA